MSNTIYEAGRASDFAQRDLREKMGLTGPDPAVRGVMGVDRPPTIVEEEAAVAAAPEAPAPAAPVTFE